MWTPHGKQGKEASKIRYQAWMYTSGIGLDIGCGDDKIAPNAIGIDTQHFAGIPLGSMIASGEKLPQFADASMDFVFSSHFLEHVADYKAALKEWWRVLKVGGRLILYLPHKDYYPNIGQPGANPDHKHDFHPNDIKQALFEVLGNTFDVVEDQDRIDRDEYSFYIVIRKSDTAGVYHPWHVRSKDHAGRTFCVARYGAIGDMALVSPIVAAYKAAGWYVAVSTHVAGRTLLAHDPNIDEFIVAHAENAFVIGSMEPFWHELGARFTRFVNLTQSIEGTLLPGPDNVRFLLPDVSRRMVCNVNYADWTFALAGLPSLQQKDRPRIKFYSDTGFTDEPSSDAVNAFADCQSKNINIGVCVAGSASHKIYPFWHAALTRLLLEHPNIEVHLLGDKQDANIGVAVKQNATAYGVGSRVHDHIGKYTIRQSICIALQCRAVFGPETGIMNWIADEDHITKVVMLSHSSHENLTKYWRSTFAMQPTGLDCYPCHRMHPTSTWCTPHASGGAACMAHTVDNAVKVFTQALFQVAARDRAPLPDVVDEPMREEQTRYGIMKYCVQDKYIGRGLAAYGEFSKGEVDLFLALIKPNDTVVDVGANIGCHTIPLARVAGTVYAFEPQTKLFNLLEHNIAINNCENVIASPRALGKEAGKVSFPDYDETREHNPGASSATYKPDGEVEVIPLDWLSITPDFIKIDVEGMELAVLQGAESIINDCLPILYVENDKRTLSKPLLTWLIEHGYECHWHVVPLYSPNNYKKNPDNIFPNIYSINVLALRTVPTAELCDEHGLVPVLDAGHWPFPNVA